jgi:serine/threonine protein kinase
MTALSDAAIDRLRNLGTWPEFESGRYAVIEEIGRGGMGTVYLAIDEELGREVAIKIPNTLDSARVDRRFRVEARALARLEHPGIVPIHDIGRLADARLFYVMKRVQGRTLRDHLRAVADLSERLRVFERLCEPVRFAHAQGVIHRDLKPENVMVGAFGEVMVMDWGVAKTLDHPESPLADPQSLAGNRDPETDTDADATGEGTVIGTRGFMAPEQAAGTPSAVDVRADVYSLGAILFLLLTNEVPSPESDQAARLRQHRVPRPLTAICAKALAIAPGDRYQTVAALADEIARYRAGRSVEAYRETIVERAGRFARAYRTAILLVLGYIVMRAAVAFLAGW